MEELLSDELSKKEVNEIYSICRKTKPLKIYEKKLLVNSKTLRNNNGESLLHYYLRSSGFDLDLIKAMHKKGYSLNEYNNENESIYQSVLLHSYAYASYKENILKYLLENNCEIGKDQQSITQTLLINYLNPSKYQYSYQTDRKNISNDYFKLLKDMLNKKKMYTDLTIRPFDCFNPANHCDSVEKLKWFKDNFRINWDLNLGKVISQNALILKSSFINHRNPNGFKNDNPVFTNFTTGNTEIIKWMVNINPKYVYRPHHNALLKKALMLFDLGLLKLLEKIKINKMDYYDDPKLSDGCDGGDDVSDEAIIDKFKKNETDIYTGFLNYIACSNNISGKSKSIYIWCIKNKKNIKLDTGVIRRLNLTLSDVKNNNGSGELHLNNYYYHNGYGRHPTCNFPNDANATFRSGEKLRAGQTPMSKNQCLGEKAKIEEYVKSL